MQIGCGNCRPSLHLELPSDTGWMCQILYMILSIALIMYTRKWNHTQLFGIIEATQQSTFTDNISYNVCFNQWYNTKNMQTAWNNDVLHEYYSQITHMTLTLFCSHCSHPVSSVTRLHSATDNTANKNVGKLTREQKYTNMTTACNFCNIFSSAACMNMNKCSRPRCKWKYVISVEQKATVPKILGYITQEVVSGITILSLDLLVKLYNSFADLALIDLKYRRPVCKWFA